MSHLLVMSAYLLGVVLWWLILFFVVRAAVNSALDSQRQALGVSNQLLSAQADLTARLAKHLIAQTELMVLQARHDGLTDEELAPVLKQVEERRADPALQLPFS